MSNLRHRFFLIAALSVLLMPVSALADDDFSFDVEEFENKSFEIGGYVEGEWKHFGFDRGSALYGLVRHPELNEGTNDQFQETLRLEGSWRGGIATLSAAAQANAIQDDFSHDHDIELFEGTLTLQPDPGVAIEVGKKALKWGKGYAWSPVGFVERTKDPDNPTESREGFVMLTGDLIASFDSPLRTVALTPVVLPVDGALNNDFGTQDEVNLAAKLYLLAWDTDIDLMVLGNGSRTTRYGFDFSRNLTENFEIHGEWARIEANRRTVADPDGPNRKMEEDATNYLLGLRYLTESDMTIIAEYYHQGTGYSEAEMRAFFDLAHQAVYSGSDSQLARAKAAQSAGFGKSTPARNYGYVSISQKEPFDLLYWTPSVKSIVNLDDFSFSVTPEIQYTGVEDLELRLRLGYLRGGRFDEYGEKANDYKLEMRARYHF